MTSGAASDGKFLRNIRHLDRRAETTSKTLIDHFCNTKSAYEIVRKMPVITLKQAAAYLQISKAHLSNVIRGKVPGTPPLRSFRVGRRVLFKREWLDQWMEATVTHTSQKW